MPPRRLNRASAVLFLALAIAGSAFGEDAPVKFPLPNPSEIGVEKFAALLNQFLEQGGYEQWQHDKEVRPSGPFIISETGAVQSYGTHGSAGIKIYYSPQIYEWLKTDRKGELPDGSMSVKVLFARDEEKPAKFSEEATGWSVMVKDKKGSWDGWFYSDGGPLSKPGPSNAETFHDPNAGFGLSCMNCHACADNKEGLFSTLLNIEGKHLNYLTSIPTTPLPKKIEKPAGIHQDKPPEEDSLFTTLKKKKDDHWKAYEKIPDGFFPKPLPFHTLDHVVQGPMPNGHKQFLTSNQCSACHGATMSTSAIPNMVFPTLNARDERKYLNFSPHGEWRYSMMGLSGRDPIFFAQLESERVRNPALAKEIDNKCLSCHSVMGQRQHALEKGKDALFTHDMLDATPDSNPANAHIAGLGRDGVSCVACHRMEPEGLGTPETYSGAFKLSSTPTTIFGPYKDSQTLPMENALGLTPKHGAHLRESKSCGSCHVVTTPILDVGKKYSSADFHTLAEKNPFHEQTTYFEWRNSVFSNEAVPGNPNAKSCQDCHMPTTHAGSTLTFRTANIQDNTFPETHNQAPLDKLTLKVRGEDPENRYARHTLNGINVFALEIFNQFPHLLGVARRDSLFPMPEAESGLKVSIDAALEMAQTQTATIEIASVKRTDKGIAAAVLVSNLAGHKFPSGVAFRRAFIEFRVQTAKQTLWVSGATNEWGEIGTYDARGNFKALPTENIDNNQFQPHHDLITQPEQVQVYEQLIADSNGRLTTSFLNLKQPIKDNRLLPRGWSGKGPHAEITQPIGSAGEDRHYQTGDGTDLVRYEFPLALPANEPVTVSATLYYQSIPPYYLRDRFKHVDQPATRNLFYFVHQLNVEKGANGALKDWKLRIVRDSKPLK